MKNKVLWMFMLVVVALVSANARAAWGPFDPNDELQINLNFQTYDNVNRTTTCAVTTFVAELFDYNTANYAVFENNGKIGYDANLAQRFDESTGSAGDCVLIFPNTINVDGALDDPLDTSMVTLGDPSLKRSWSFWVWPKNTSTGTFIRHQNYDTATYPNAWWEIRLSGGRLQFYQSASEGSTGGVLRMQTVESASQYLTANQWNHIIVVIDRSAQENSKIYVNGVKEPVSYLTYKSTGSGTIDSGDVSPYRIGKGNAEFDGRIDEVRLYSKALTDLEASILYQKQNDGGNPVALLPIPQTAAIPVDSNLTWVKVEGNVGQYVFFGTGFADVNEAIATTDPTYVGGGTTAELIDNSALNGGNDLLPGTKYYWKVRSRNGTTYQWFDGPIWSFTTETAIAADPIPADGADHVEGTNQIADVNLSWTGPSTATDYSVYVSTDKSLIDNNTPSTRLIVGLTATETNMVSPQRNADVYWRVDSNLPTGMVTGPTWTFRTRPYEIIINTKSQAYTRFGHTFPAYGIHVHGDGWYYLTADGNQSTHTTEAEVVGKLQGGLIVFDFNAFNFDRRFEIVAIPEYRGQDINEYLVPRPVAINVKNGGNFYFDGTMNISGNDVVAADDSDTELRARCGGFPGPKRNQDASVFPAGTAVKSDYWTLYSAPAGNYTRFGTLTSGKDVYVPTALAYSTWGPGHPDNPPYKGGSGGGHAGRGGQGGRSYAAGVLGGAGYGSKEVGFPFGGSAGGWGGADSPGGCPGGGGFEIAAQGSVTLDSNCVILAKGGSSTDATGYRYANGGGAGGSVRIIGNDVTIKGTINVDGGKGGNAASGEGENDTGGGGSAGRIAIFYNNSLDIAEATLSSAGGDRGILYGSNTGIAKAGAPSTPYITDATPEKASNPIPADGDDKVYAAAGGTAITLKWDAGYGAASDVVYFGTVPVGSAVTSPARGQRSATTTVTIYPNQTYTFYVKSDGSVNSDVWSFSTVGWQCQYVASSTPYVKGPSWDTNDDCVVNAEDLWYYAQDWSNPEFGTLNLGYESDGEGDTNLSTMYRFVNEWLVCKNRIGGAGCTGWIAP